MSDAPETIWAYEQSGSRVRIWRANNDRKGSVSYTRTDHVQTLIAAELEALADHVSANCFSLPSGDASRSYNAGVRDAIDAIRARTYADAQAALEARDKRVRDEALREAACWAAGVSRDAEKVILALIDADNKEP